MKDLALKVVVKLFKARWGSILPAIFKAAAEGQFGEPVKRMYWFLNGYATFTGMMFVFAGTGLESIAASYPEYGWIPVAAAWVYRVGTVLAAAGLLRGGVNSPWPEGAQAEHEKGSGTMKKIAFGALALAALLPATSYAQESQRRLTLAYAWDMDGEAADADQIVTAVGGVIVDNGTSVGGADYTITAQPDSCRLIDMTISDTDMTAGTITVDGVGCLGEARTCTWSAWTAGDDDGVKTLVCTDGDSAYFRSITSVTTGVMTGESDEYFTLGYTSNSDYARVMYGRLMETAADGTRRVDPFGSYAINLPITTSAALSTTVTAVSSNGAFTNVAVGDLLLFKVAGADFERKVTARASANSITVNKAINIPASGVTFNYKKFYYSTNPNDLLLIPVRGFRTLLFSYDVAANANTGGVLLNLSCTADGPGFPADKWYTPTGYATPLPVTIASAATGYASYVHDISEDGGAPAAYCQVVAKFGTGDDADAAAEDIDLTVTLAR